MQFQIDQRLAYNRLRLVAIELQMAPVRNAVHIGMVEFRSLMQEGKEFDDFPHLAKSATTMLNDIVWWAKVLKTVREVSA